MQMYGPSREDAPLLDDIDLYDQDRYANGSQHPAWAVLRERAPVWRQDTHSGVPFWSVTRYSDVVKILKDTRNFSSETGTLLSVIDGDPAGGKTILLTDPPMHSYFKGPMTKLMTSRTAPRHTDRIAENVRRLVEPYLGGGRHDFVRIVDVLPMAAAGAMLGIPQEHWHDVARWTMTGLAPEDPAYAAGTPQMTLRTAHHQLFALFSEIVAERRRRPADDLISALLTLDFGDRGLTSEEVLFNCYTWAMGTNSTTPHVASHMLLALIQHPEAWQKLRRDRSLVPLAVEEVCRWTTPTNHLLRRTTAEVRIRDVTIPAGAPVCAWLASANRDEKVFAEPFTFDPARRPNRHIAFGLGTHYCTGARAARMVLSVLLEELLDKFERFELDGEPRHLRSNFVNGMSSLPVLAHPAAAQRRPTIDIELIGQ